MGIDGYRKQLSKKFPECWIRIQDTVPKHRGTPGARREHNNNNGPSTATAAHRFDHIYVDLNGLIHTSGRRARDEEQLVLLLFRQLDHLFKLCVPTTSVFLALDGPASAAKLITQRTRRIKSVEKQKRSAAAAAATVISITSSTIEEQSVEDKAEAEEEDSIDDEEGEEVERQLPQKQDEQQTNINNYNKRRKAKQKGGFDLLQVTAGTPFMHRLKKSLCYWVCSRLQNDRKYHAIKFFVSGPDVAGEGEVKIMENISVRARQDSNFRKVQSHLIVGSDADLILMGLSSSIDNMFILTTDGQSPDFLLFSVHQFSASMQLWFPGSDCNRIKLDFMLLSLFLGNDYLPKLRCCSFESLWQRYKRLKYNPRYKAEYLFNKEDYTLNWSFLLDVFGSYGKHIRPLPKGPSPSSQRIQTNEQRIAPTTGTNTKEKNNDEEEDDEVICFRGFLPGSASVVSDDKSKENIDEEKDEAEMDGEQVEEEEEGENDEDDIQLEGLVYGCDPYEYMQGILWCAKMYIEGRCPDYRWYYHYRYAPTAAEIRQCFLPGHIGITQRSKSNNRRGRGRGGREGQQQQTIAMPDEEEATPVIPARDLHVPSSSEPPLHPYQFCMTVLPLQAKQYVYAPLQQLMNLEESPLAYIYKPDNHSAVVDIDHIKSVVETVPLHNFAEEDKEGLFLGTHLTYARRQSRWKDENKADEFWPKPPISKGIFSLPFPSPPTPKYRPLLAPPSKTLICWRTAHHHAPERVKISSKNHMNNRRQQQQTAAPPSFVPLLFSASSQSVPKKQPQQLQQTATPPSFIPLLSSTSSAQEHQPQQVPKPANPPSFIPLLSSSSPQEQQASPQGYLHSPSNAATPFYPPFPYYPPHYFYPQSSSFRNGVFYPPPQSDELQQYPLQHQLPPAVFYPPPSSVLPSPFATQTAPAPQQGVSPSSSVDQMAELLRQLQRSSLNSK